MLSELPFDVLLQIFLRTDDETLDSCRKTCREFKEILEGESYWLARIHSEKCLHVLPPPKWRYAVSMDELFIKSNFVDASSFEFDYRTMLKSRKGFKARLFEIQPGMSIDEQLRVSNLRGYSSTTNGIRVEENNVGCNPDQSVHFCHAFSDEPASIQVVVVFSEWGISDWILDYVRPTIRVSMKVNHHFDGDAKLTLGAELNYTEDYIRLYYVSSDKATMNGKNYRGVRRHWKPQTDANWEDMSVELDNYASGFRRMMISIRGIGSCLGSMPGFYGPKIANVEVEVIMPEKVVLKRFEDATKKEKTRIPRRNARSHRQRVPPI